MTMEELINALELCSRVTSDGPRWSSLVWQNPLASGRKQYQILRLQARAPCNLLIFKCARSSVG